MQERLDEKYRVCAPDKKPEKPGLDGLVLPSEAKLPVADFIVHQGDVSLHVLS